VAKRSTFWGTLALALALVFGFVLAGCASAPPDLTDVTTYYVRANGRDRNPGVTEQKPFKTLTRAIAAASGSPVKTITVLGTLTTPLPNITEGTGAAEILITGKAGAAEKDKAVLQIIKEGKAFIIGGDSRIRFEYITITGGTFGGITVNEGAMVTLGRDAVVSGNARKYGGGVAVFDGGALVLSDNALVTKNKANRGGGIVVASGTLLLQDDALVSENEAVIDSDNKNGHGGGIYAENTEITMKGNASIAENTGYWGAGIYVNGTAALVMQDSASIKDNTMFYHTSNDNTHVGGTGGGAYIAGSLTMRDNSVVSGNDGASGGGVFLDDATMVMEDRSTVKNNNANGGKESNGKLFGGYGGGVRIDGGTLTMKGESSLDGNSGFLGGGLSIASKASVILEGKAAIKGSTIKRNTEQEYGGYGGGVGLWGSLVLKDDAVLANNSAYLGGGAYVYKDATLTLQDRAAVQRNKAERNAFGGNGGGAIVRGTFTMRDTAQVSGNTALYGAGIDLYGELILEGNVKVTENSATQDGGGVYINKDGVITGDQSLISGNKASKGVDIFIGE
jgi:hypothetical protein